MQAIPGLGGGSLGAGQGRAVAGLWLVGLHGVRAMMNKQRKKVKTGQPGLSLVCMDSAEAGPAIKI